MTTMHLGAVYGRLTGFGRNTLKTDIIHFFEGSDLAALDVKFEYNNSFTPISMFVQCIPSSFLLELLSLLHQFC